MFRLPFLCLVLLSPGVALLAHDAPQMPTRRLPLSVYRDKMEAGWIGQMVGVAWGGPTEFRWQGAIIPEDQMPRWDPARINDAFGQDDLYVEMTFLRTLEQYGLGVSARQAGIDFANSTYPLWCANRAGRNNLRRGIAPPDSGHPHFSRHSDDIDYQIESDFAGLISPGLPSTVIALGETFGRLMCYGDGLYAGQFVGAMYAEAFFESDPLKLVDAALLAIPAGSQYAEMVRDVRAWYLDHPDDWQRTWELVTAKYLRNPAYRRYSSMQGEGSIDARLNGAYILIGLLHGQGDLDRSIMISTRCGQDSDCNPSNTGGVLFTTVGAARLPERFTSALDRQRTFAHAPYTFEDVLQVCEQLARQAVVQAGGRIERSGTGEEVFVIPHLQPAPGPLEQSWKPGPIANSRYTPEELAQIREPDEVTRALRAVAPGWQLHDCGPDMGAPSLLDEFRGRREVLITHPLDRTTPSRLTGTLAIPAAGETHLRISVGHHPQGDWKLVVRANGITLCEQIIGPETATEGWTEVAVDLSAYAGQQVQLELLNQPTGWAWEAAYWGQVAVETR